MKYLAAMVFFVVALPASAAESERRIALLEVRASADLDPERAELFAEFLLEALRKRGHTVLGAAEMETLLGPGRMQDALACNAPACFAALASALGVDEMMRGSLIATAGNITVSIARRATHGEIVRTSQLSVSSATDKALIDAAPRLAEELFVEKVAVKTNQGIRFETEDGRGFDVEVSAGGHLLKCAAKVTSALPCFLEVPQGHATIRVASETPDEVELGSGTYAYRMAYVDPALAYGGLGLLVAGAALTAFGMTGDCPSSERTCERRSLPTLLGLSSGVLGALATTFGFVGMSHRPLLVPVESP